MRPAPAVGQTHTSGRIEALRAGAALSVVIYHIQVMTHGYNGDWAALPATARVTMFGSFGVDVFFVLSGYLLFRPFVRSARSGGSIDLRRYAVNRAVRILPLYYIAVIMLLATQPGGASWDEVWRHLLFAQNLSLGTRLVDGPLWSLVCEVEFYTILPILALLILKPAVGDTRRMVAATGGFAIAALWLASLTWGARPAVVWQFSLLANLVGFGSGMFIAALETHLSHRPSRLRTRPALALGAVGAVAAWTLSFPAPSRLDILVASALTVAVVVTADHALAPSRRRFAPFAALGIASYSLYVWHVPVIERLMALHVLASDTLINALIVIPVCVMLAAVSYRFVERPFLQLRRRWSGELHVGPHAVEAGLASPAPQTAPP